MTLHVVKVWSISFILHATNATVKYKCIPYGLNAYSYMYGYDGDDVSLSACSNFSIIVSKGS